LQIVKTRSAPSTRGPGGLGQHHGTRAGNVLLGADILEAKRAVDMAGAVVATPDMRMTARVVRVREHPVDECGEEWLAEAASGVRHGDAAEEFAAVAVVPVLEDGKALRRAARVETDQVEPVVVGEVGAVYVL